MAMTHRHGPDEGWGVLMANSAIVCFSTLSHLERKKFLGDRSKLLRSDHTTFCMEHWQVLPALFTLTKSLKLVPKYEV